MNTVITFNGNTELHAQFLAQAQHHFDADMLRAGTYGIGDGKSFQACSIGCYAHDLGFEGNYHAQLAEHYALPEWLWRWRDTVFEGLPENERATFHLELSNRIPVGVDMEAVPHLLAMARIERLLDRLRPQLEAGHGYGVSEAIAGVVNVLETQRRLHEAQAGGTSCDWSAWSAAWSAARSARSAAESAAARSAAESAGEVGGVVGGGVGGGVGVVGGGVGGVVGGVVGGGVGGGVGGEVGVVGGGVGGGGVCGEVGGIPGRARRDVSRA